GPDTSAEFAPETSPGYQGPDCIHRDALVPFGECRRSCVRVAPMVQREEVPVRVERGGAGGPALGVRAVADARAVAVHGGDRLSVKCQLQWRPLGVLHDQKWPVGPEIDRARRDCDESPGGGARLGGVGADRLIPWVPFDTQKGVVQLLRAWQ